MSCPTCMSPNLPVCMYLIFSVLCAKKTQAYFDIIRGKLCVLRTFSFLVCVPLPFSCNFRFLCTSCLYDFIIGSLTVISFAHHIFLFVYYTQSNKRYLSDLFPGLSSYPIIHIHILFPIIHIERKKKCSKPHSMYSSSV